MSKKMTKIRLLDGETRNIYAIEVSEEDAARVTQDMSFAAQLLNDYKALIAQSQDETEEIEAEFSPIADIYQATEETIQEQKKQSNSEEKDCFRWPHEAILLLFSLYKEHEDQILYGKMSLTKFWMMIAAKLVEKNFNVTGSQCKSKMAGLKNTYKSVRDYNARCISSNNIRTWRYYDIMDELCKNSETSTLTLDNSNSTSTNNIGKKRNSPSKTELPSKRLKHCNLLERVLAVAKKSTIERRKMHEEAMARQDKLLDILEKMTKK